MSGHIKTQKVNIGGSFSLTYKSNLIMVLFKIEGTILRWKKIHEWKELILRVM